MRGLLAAAALMLAGAAPPPGPQATLELWRLDCGTIGWERELSNGCYLIRNGDRYLLWDAGLTARIAGSSVDVGGQTYTLRKTVVEQLAEIGVTPDDVTFVGISHYHGDHTGQASKLPKATLLIGAGDFDAIRRDPPPQGASADHLGPWVRGEAPVVTLGADHDVFGDGRVVMLATPGHTEGHNALLVKLASGPLLLTGDLYMFQSEIGSRSREPGNDVDTPMKLQSRNRFEALASALRAKVIVQHDPADVAQLPAFPQSAR